MAKIIGVDGTMAEVKPSLDWYREAADKGLTVPQYVNATYDTDAAKYGSAFEQVLASEGVFLQGDKASGMRPSTVQEVMDGTGAGMHAGAITRDATPATRIVFPAAILQAIENKLVGNLTLATDAFEKMVAVDDTIPGDLFIRPVLDYSRPEGARSQRIAQLAAPAAMLSITVSETSKRVPTFSLGMEMSDQAVKNVTIDLVALALARQLAMESNLKTYEYILYLLNGDPDLGTVALSSISGKVVKASSFDSAIVTAGVLSHNAWMQWLFKNSLKRNITHVITDIKGALAIEQRTGKPTNFTDNPNSTRIDTISVAMNPSWPANVQVFITQDPNWPANTIMGIDQKYAIHRVKSLIAQYAAVETFVMNRKSEMRFDYGEIIYRLFDDAYEVLTLVP